MMKKVIFYDTFDNKIITNILFKKERIGLAYETFKYLTK